MEHSSFQDEIFSFSPPLIIVDFSEPEQIVRVLKEMGCNVLRKKLPFDYAIISDKIYIVERKSDEDFLNSIVDNRIFEQLLYLSSLKQVNKDNEKQVVVFLVVEGDLYRVHQYRCLIAKSLGKRCIPVSSIFGVLMGFVRAGIGIIPVPSTAETIILFDTLYKRYTKKKQEVYSFRVIPKKRELTPTQRAVAVLEGVVGTKTAIRILSELKTLKNVANATPEQLKKIRGIGEKTAEKIYETFNSIFNPEEL